MRRNCNKNFREFLNNLVSFFVCILHINVSLFLEISLLDLGLLISLKESNCSEKRSHLFNLFNFGNFGETFLKFWFNCHLVLYILIIKKLPNNGIIVCDNKKFVA